MWEQCLYASISSIFKTQNKLKYCMKIKKNRDESLTPVNRSDYRGLFPEITDCADEEDGSCALLLYNIYERTVQIDLLILWCRTI